MVNLRGKQMHKVNKNNDYIPVSWKTISYILMISFTVLTIFPLVWLFYSSFKTHGEILNAPLALPKDPTVINYINAWTIGNMDIALLNSIFYTFFSTVLTVFLALSAGFALSKIKSRWSGIIYGALTVGLLFTVQSAIVPLFLMESRLGIINTRLGVIIPYIAFGLPMSTLIAYSYIRSIPDALIESASIDGANYIQIFFSIIIPCSTPVIATMTILSFLRHWNEFIFVFVLTTGNNMRSLPVAIYSFAGRLNSEYGMQFAALVISIIPMIVFYMIFHKQLIKGFGEGALKE